MKRKADASSLKRCPDKYAETLRELLRAKVEQRAPQIEVAPEGKAPEVINIMDALKRSMQAKGRTKVRDAVREELASLRKRNSQGRQHHDRGQARVGRRIEARLALTSGEFLPRP